MKISTLSKFSLVFAFCMVFTSLLFIDQSELPDYTSYSNIYLTADDRWEWSPGFSALMILFSKIGMTYEQVRIALASAGLLGLVWLVFLKPDIQFIGFNKYFSLVLICFLVPAVSIFFIEFFYIRLRAGLTGLLVVCIAGAVLFSLKQKLGFFKKLLFCSAGLIAAAIHPAMFLCLSFWIGLPFFWSTFKSRSSKSTPAFLFDFVLATIIVTAVINTSSVRGEHLDSPLNPVRVLLMCFIPLIFYLGHIIARSRKINFAISESYVYYDSLLRLYALSSILLIVFFLTGGIESQGEAMVRFYTGSVFSFILALLLVNNPSQAVSASYIIFVNSLFFINTVWL